MVFVEKKKTGKKKFPQPKHPKKKIPVLDSTQYGYADLFENAPVGLLTFDKDTVIIDVNQEGARLFKVKKGDLINTPFLRFISQDSISLFTAHLDRTLGKKSKKTCEVILKNKKGALFPAHIETICNTDKKRSVHWFQAAIIDISKHHKAEEALKLSEAALRETEEKYRTLVENPTDDRDTSIQKMLETKLQHSQKMEAIGTLAGGIAHDFNNILGSIMLNTELALDDVEKKSETEYALEQVFEASQRAKVLIEQILTFSRNADVERIPLKINAIIKETIKMMKAMLPSTILIKPDIPNNIGTILINPVQIQQLLVNLCTNAAHAMQDEGGILAVTLKNIKLKKSTAKLSGLPPGQYVKLSVSDSGKGIAPDDLERIFDPFFTTKSAGKGTGLGLSVVHGIVSNHNGGITVDSKLNKGTTFNIFFTIINGATTHKKKKHTSLPKGNKNILFIDDEESLLDAGSRMLKRLGYSVTVSSSGEKALKLLKKQQKKFDLVITDMTMPYMTGIELTKKLLDIREDIPIILCTGFNEKITPEKAKAFGIKKYIMKPYTQEDMSKAVNEIFKQ